MNIIKFSILIFLLPLYTWAIPPSLQRELGSKRPALDAQLIADSEALDQWYKKVQDSIYDSSSFESIVEELINDTNEKRYRIRYFILSYAIETLFPGTISERWSVFYKKYINRAFLYANIKNNNLGGREIDFKRVSELTPQKRRDLGSMATEKDNYQSYLLKAMYDRSDNDFYLDFQNSPKAIVPAIQSIQAVLTDGITGSAIHELFESGQALTPMLARLKAPKDESIENYFPEVEIETWLSLKFGSPEDYVADPVELDVYADIELELPMSLIESKGIAPSELQEMIRFCTYLTHATLGAEYRSRMIDMERTLFTLASLPEEDWEKMGFRPKAQWEEYHPSGKVLPDGNKLIRYQEMDPELYSVFSSIHLIVAQDLAELYRNQFIDQIQQLARSNEAKKLNISEDLLKLAMISSHSLAESNTALAKPMPLVEEGKNIRDYLDNYEEIISRELNQYWITRYNTAIYNASNLVSDVKSKALEFKLNIIYPDMIAREIEALYRPKTSSSFYSQIPQPGSNVISAKDLFKQSRAENIGPIINRLQHYVAEIQEILIGVQSLRSQAHKGPQFDASYEQARVQLDSSRYELEKIYITIGMARFIAEKSDQTQLMNELYQTLEQLYQFYNEFSDFKLPKPRRVEKLAQNQLDEMKSQLERGKRGPFRQVKSGGYSFKTYAVWLPDGRHLALYEFGRGRKNQFYMDFSNNPYGLSVNRFGAGNGKATLSFEISGLGITGVSELVVDFSDR